MTVDAVAVVHTVASLTPNSGVTQVLLDYLHYSTRAGLTSRCIHFDEFDAPITHRSSQPADLRSQLVSARKPGNPWTQFSTFASLLEACVHDLYSQGHSVVIHDHGLWLPTNLAASSVARKLGCPYAITPHGMLQPIAMAHTFAKKRLAWTLYERRKLQGARFLHVTSDIEAVSVSRLMPEARVVQVPLGIDVGPALEQAAQTKRREIIYLGRLHPLKGISMLLQAWQRAHQAGWQLKLTGPCEAAYQSQLKQEVTELGLDGSVTFTGPLYGADKEAALCGSSVLVLPSFSENFGMVIAEALAHALPVITTDATPWHGVQDRHCGWVTAPDADAIAGALRDAMNRPATELSEMGLRGRSWILASFDLPTVISRMHQHYLELTGD